MSSTNSATLKLTLTPSVTSLVYPFASSSFAVSPLLVFDGGTTAGNIDQTYQSQITATTSGASVQLNGGGLLDPVGNAVSPVRLDALIFTNVGTNNVSASGALFASGYTAGASFSIPLPPSSLFIYSTGTSSNSGLPNGSATNSTITFTSVGGTSAVQVYAAGRSV